MSSVLVDSNVLLDIITEDETWFNRSAGALAVAAERHRLVINVIVYAEISVRYTRAEELEDVLSGLPIAREAIPFDAAFLAGKIFANYRKRGGIRVAPLPDFFIGAHAAVSGYELLTRDPKRYRHNFPTVGLIAP